MHQSWSLFFFLSVLVTSIPLNGTSLEYRDTNLMRDIYVIMYTYTPGEDAPLEVDPLDGKYYLATHSAIFITGNENDGAVMTHIVEDNLNTATVENPDAPEELQVRTTIDDPLDPGESTKIPGQKTDDYVTRATFKVDGQVPWTNQQLMDSETGNGIIWDSWKGNTVYMQRDNNCHSLVRNILAQASLKVPDPINQIMIDDHNYQQLIATKSPTGQHIDDTVKFERVVGVKKVKGLRQFTIGGSSGSPTLQGADEALAEPFQEYGDTDPNPKKSKVNFVGKENIDPSICLSRRGLHRRDCLVSSPADITTDVDKLQTASGKASNVVYARAKGVLTIVQAFTREVATGVGIAAAVLEPVFIILDLINGDFKSAAFGLASAAIGIASAFGGPIGFAVGAVLSVLFAILPGLFDHKDLNPPSNNPAQIIQFTFFGNKDTTGNEACNKNLASKGLTQNCSALYGPGVISSLFKWELFDAVAFLLEFNNGYPMTILDIAASFHNIDHTIQGDGNNASATIDCGTATHLVHSRMINPAAQGRPVLSSPSLGFDCGSPVYALKRNAITVPVINQTADLVHNRLIPAPGGDCKILVDGPGGLSLPLYNITLSGRPAAIACNITQPAVNEVVNINGTIPADAQLNQVTLNALAALGSSNVSVNQIVQIVGQSGTTQIKGVVSPGNASTNGISGAGYIKPPAPQAFANLTAANYACFSSNKGGGSLCLPNGTYSSINVGKHGFDIRKATDLNMPTGAYLNLSLPANVNRPSIPAPMAYVDSLYSTNISASNKQFASDIFSMATYDDAETTARSSYDVIIPTSVPQLPLACLFSSLHYAGDVACFGVGGFNLSSQYQNMAQSVKLYGNASIWMYPQFYGDIGGVPTTTDIPDLTTIPYSTGSLSGKIVALWVHAGT